MIKNMDMVYLNGQMEENMKVCRQMVNNMEEVHILVLMVKEEKENGQMVKGLVGLKKMQKKKKINMIK